MKTMTHVLLLSACTIGLMGSAVEVAAAQQLKPGRLPTLRFSGTVSPMFSSTFDSKLEDFRPIFSPSTYNGYFAEAELWTTARLGLFQETLLWQKRRDGSEVDDLERREPKPWSVLDPVRVSERDRFARTFACPVSVEARIGGLSSNGRSLIADFKYQSPCFKDAGYTSSSDGSILFRVELEVESCDGKVLNSAPAEPQSLENFLDQLDESNITQATSCVLRMMRGSVAGDLRSFERPFFNWNLDGRVTLLGSGDLKISDSTQGYFLGKGGQAKAPTSEELASNEAATERFASLIRNYGETMVIVAQQPESIRAQVLEEYLASNRDSMRAALNRINETLPALGLLERVKIQRSIQAVYDQIRELEKRINTPELFDRSVL